ncbi:hypothetical protein PSHI_54090 [Pseudomonas sp. URMO17WK12:I11]|jgi:hypothetical protein|nr:hypothetical protein PSHI_54090 [Pseudomonas sp. URMO17WK12:I11]
MPLINRLVRLVIFYSESSDGAGRACTANTEFKNARSVVTDMNRKNVKDKHAEGVTFDTHVIANPTNPKEWIVFFKKDAGRSYFLVDDNEEVETFGHLDDLIAELRDLGLKTAEIHF